MQNKICMNCSITYKPKTGNAYSFCSTECTLAGRGKITTAGCFEWQGAIRKNTGYGSITVNKKTEDVHRVSYRLTFGEYEKGLYVCHHCDNRKCYNPNHLFLGTCLDNSRDMWKKGRQSKTRSYTRGSDRKNSKLDEKQVLEILAIGHSVPFCRTAKLYGVSHPVISSIVRGTRWRHLSTEK